MIKESPNWSHAEFGKYLSEPVKNCILCAPVTAHEPSHVVNSLNISKSPRSDEIGAKITTEIAPIINEPLLHV